MTEKIVISKELESANETILQYQHVLERVVILLKRDVIDPDVANFIVHGILTDDLKIRMAD